MPMCIYCLEEKPTAEFDKDHVVPKSFGKFENGLTLVERVCADCNKYLGDNVELFLARDSLEGWLRIRYGLKDPSEFKPFHDKRCVFKLGDENDLTGVIVQPGYDKSKNEITVEPVSQIGVPKQDGSGWEFFKVDEMPSLAELEERGFETQSKKDWRAVFNAKEGSERLFGTLKEKGIEIEPRGQSQAFVEQGLRKIDGTSIIDKVIFRGIAKIAFNYMAKFQSVNFVLDESFSGIRRFIRYGEGQSSEYVQFRPRPLLYRRSRFSSRRAIGHIITLEWDTNRSTLFSSVSLFNQIAYKVRLCTTFRGLYREVASIHFFNLRSRDVSRIQMSNIIIP